jgi:hypothetical protein
MTVDGKTLCSLWLMSSLGTRHTAGPQASQQLIPAMFRFTDSFDYPRLCPKQCHNFLGSFHRLGSVLTFIEVLWSFLPCKSQTPRHICLFLALALLLWGIYFVSGPQRGLLCSQRRGQGDCASSSSSLDNFYNN